jgi:hypothetical protein
MCESCSPSTGLDRREFLAAAGVLGTAGLVTQALAQQAATGSPTTRPMSFPLDGIKKEPARVMVAFLYPTADVVNEGKNEDNWRVNNWFTWPGNQFEPEQQEQKFTAKIREIAERLGVAVEFEPKHIYQEAKVKAFIDKAKSSRPDAVLIVNFWNTFSKWSFQIATEAAPTAIVYHSVGSNHQLPPDYLRNTEGLYYIHSIENFDEIERGLIAVRAGKALSQSRMLRISGRVKTPTPSREEKLGIEVIESPAEEFNTLFDAVKPDDAIVRAAMQVKQQSMRVMDVTDAYFVEALRAHAAVKQIMARYGADAITIECLQLKHRKPCISFATNNGDLIPCGCENDFNATLTLMVGRWLLDRGGFQHNPEFDTSENRYFASHCTCAWKLQGPQGPSKEYLVRPFFHQLPKTAALDVQWTPGEPIVLAKYISTDNTLCCWTGKVIESPTSPPTGGCATRVLMEIDKVDDVCSIYAGPHPILYCANRSEARRLKAFAKLSRLNLQGNV